jgi:hypothetical protein
MLRTPEAIYSRLDVLALVLALISSRLVFVRRSHSHSRSATPFRLRSEIHTHHADFLHIPQSHLSFFQLYLHGIIAASVCPVLIISA